jgi:hypothetical protein
MYRFPAIAFCLLGLTGPLLGAEADALTAQEVSWPAGTYSFSNMLERLSVGGNGAMLGLGQSPAAIKTLPAYKGPWWGGLITVCTTFGAQLESPPLPRWQIQSQVMAIPFGPLSKVQGNQPSSCNLIPICQTPALFPLLDSQFPFRATVCGPFLFRLESARSCEVRRLTGLNSWVELTLSARLEPRLDRQAIHSCSITWKTVKSDVNDIVTLGLAGADDNRSNYRYRNRWNQDYEDTSASPAMQLRLTGVSAQAKKVTLTGTCDITLRHTWNWSGSIAPDKTTTFTWGTEKYTLAYNAPKAKGEDDNNRQQGKLVLTHQGTTKLLGSPSFFITSQTGEFLNNYGAGSSSDGEQQSYTYMLYNNAIDGEACNVSIRAYESLMEKKIPLDLTVDLP